MMARESVAPKTMNATAPRQQYLGAYLAEERRLVLVGIEETKPWDAFRRMRRAMRRERAASAADIALFTSPTPLEHVADVIPLASRRRAG